MVVGIGASHADELVPRDAQALGIGTHILAEEALVEVVVAGRHGRVDGIESAGANQLHSLVERQMLLLDIVAEALQVAECGMSLVAVVDVLLDAQLLQRQHASDAQQDLLLQAVLPVAAIERVGDGLVELGVHLVVGVEQIELDASDVHTPHVCVYHIVRIGHVDHHRLSVLVELAHNGQVGEVLCLVFSNLLSVHRQALCEIAEAIEESHGTHVDVRVAGLLQIVACQHAKAAAVDLQGRVHAVLHREIGHRGALLVGLHVHIGAEELIDGLDALHQGLVLHDGLLARKAQSLEQQHGVVLHVVIHLWVEVAEEVAGLIIPHPPEVVGNLVEALQLLRKARFHGQLLPLRSVRIVCFDFHLSVTIYNFFTIFSILPISRSDQRGPHPTRLKPIIVRPAAGSCAAAPRRKPRSSTV